MSKQRNWVAKIGEPRPKIKDDGGNKNWHFEPRSELRDRIAAIRERHRPTEGLAFRPIFGGYYIGDAVFPDWLGFRYIRTLLLSPDPIEAWQLAWPGRLTEPTSEEKENARSSVTHAIRKAINALAQTPCTENIGFHLDDYLITGTFCVYEGKEIWACEE